MLRRLIVGILQLGALPSFASLYLDDNNPNNLPTVLVVGANHLDGLYVELRAKFPRRRIERVDPGHD